MMDNVFFFLISFTFLSFFRVFEPAILSFSYTVFID